MPMDRVPVKCVKCGYAATVPNAWLDKGIKCPKCGGAFKVESEQEAAAQVAAAPPQPPQEPPVDPPKAIIGFRGDSNISFTFWDISCALNMLLVVLGICFLVVSNREEAPMDVGLGWYFETWKLHAITWIGIFTATVLALFCGAVEAILRAINRNTDAKMDGHESR